MGPKSGSHMKLVFYVKEVLPWEGSIQALVAILAEGLADRAAVTVVTESSQGGFVNAASRYRVVRKPRFFELIQVFRQADVVHLAGPALLPFALCLLLRKPVVVEHHGFQSICPNGLLFHEPTRLPCPGHFMAGRHLECLRCNADTGWRRSLVSWALTFPRRWLCRGAASNIAPTQWLNDLLQLPRTATVHHGIRLPAGAPAATPVPGRFCFVGRMVSTKGGHVLLEAARLLRQSGEDFEIHIVGEGPELDSLRAQAACYSLGDTVKFLGYLSTDELDTEFSSCAAVLMPSLGGEVFGLVAAESMARGCATIVSSLGSLSEVIGDAGWSVPPGDAAALADGMRRLLREPGLADKLRRAGTVRVRQFFQTGAMIEGHWAVYKKCR